MEITSIVAELIGASSGIQLVHQPAGETFSLRQCIRRDIIMIGINRGSLATTMGRFWRYLSPYLPQSSEQERFGIRWFGAFFFCAAGGWFVGADSETRLSSGGNQREP